MIFKQGILREEKIKFFIGVIGVLLLYIPIFIIGITPSDIKYILMFLLLFLPLFALFLFIGALSFEWFHIYEDRIEARYILGRKNIVYFDKVSFVEETTINLTSRGMKKTFYIFNDGRKNNNSLIDLNSCYNKKKFNLRIYKTPELENYLNNLYLDIKMNIK